MGFPDDNGIMPGVGRFSYLLMGAAAFPIGSDFMRRGLSVGGTRGISID
jgi:hypothetical protein